MAAPALCSPPERRLSLLASSVACISLFVGPGASVQIDLLFDDVIKDQVLKFVEFCGRFSVRMTCRGSLRLFWFWWRLLLFPLFLLL